MRSLRYKLAILLLAGSIFATAPNPAIDALLAPLSDGKSPGFAVLVRENGRNVFIGGYGASDLRTFRHIDESTNFRLASFTKQFTAMAIMLLVHDGKLLYDENLAEMFPGFPAYGRAITVRHLLTHTSGLMDYETLMEEKEKLEGPLWSATKQIHDEDVLTLLAQQTRGDFTPGTKWAYSNSGYVVLGLVASKISGMPFAEFLQRRIFGPLKMVNTVAYMEGQNTVSHRAYGYSKKDGQWQDTDQSATSATLGDGGIYSNLRDLARWDAALASEKLLPKTDIAAALVPVKLIDNSEPTDGQTRVAYGFGWFLDPLDGRARMWHSGTTSGFRTVIERFPEESRTVVILSNRTDLDPAQLAEKIASAYFSK
jgi:CubicO group peptidase (beta-lactamase class C family)